MKRKKHGFTLIELLIVIAIIAVLVAVALPQFLKSKKSANQSAVKHSLRDLITGEVQYYADNNGVFTTLATLKTDGYIDMGQDLGGGLAAQDNDCDVDGAKELVADMDSEMWARDRYYWQFSLPTGAANYTTFCCATIPITANDGDFEYFTGSDNCLRQLADNDDDVIDILGTSSVID